MKRTIMTLTTSLLALTVAFGSTSVLAKHNDNVLRVHLPVHDQGPETLPLRKMIRHQRGIDLNDYRLQAVVLKNGPFSNGYATLRVGAYRSGRVFLPGREYVRIAAPGQSPEKWQLRLGPGSQVRMVTAILEPRTHHQVYRSGYPYQYGDSYGHGQGHHNGHLQGHLQGQRRSHGDKPYRKQSQRLQKTRQELARTEAELERARNRLEHSRKQNRQLKQRQDRVAQAQLGDRRQDNPSRDRSRQPDAEKPQKKRSGGDLGKAYPRLRTHTS